MKFLLCTGIYPPEIGGPATVMGELVRELRAHGHEARVVTFGTAADQEGVTRIARGSSFVVRTLMAARAIRRALTAETVVVGTDVSSIGLPVRLALIGRKNRFVLRLGGEWMWEDAVNRGERVTLKEFWSSGRNLGVKKLIPSWILRRATKIAVTSDILRAPLAVLAPSMHDRIVTTPNIPIKTSCVPAPHPPYGGLRVLYAGRFAPVKNVPFFARALKNAVERGAAISMVFVGDGREQNECEKILEGVPHVRFLGVKAPNDINNLLSEADLYVLPSLSDVCPNGALEALGCGVPCLITREHGLLDGVGGLCELDPKDERAWVDALIRFSNDRSALEELRKKIRLPDAPSTTLADVLTVV